MSYQPKGLLSELGPLNVRVEMASRRLLRGETLDETYYESLYMLYYTYRYRAAYEFSKGKVIYWPST